MDTKIIFDIDGNTIEDILIGDDYETIGRQMEGQPVGPHRLAHMAARFMVDENGKTIPHPQALRILGSLPGREYKAALRRFSEKITQVLVPNRSGAASSLPLPVDSPKTATPLDGYPS